MKYGGAHNPSASRIPGRGMWARARIPTGRPPNRRPICASLTQTRIANAPDSQVSLGSPCTGLRTAHSDSHTRIGLANSR